MRNKIIFLYFVAPNQLFILFMKKIMLLLTFIVTAIAGAQNFPGEMVELLDGKELRVIPLELSSQKYGYREFFTDSNLKKIYKKDSYSTKHDALADKVFKVVSYEPYNSYGTRKYKIQIENPDTGKLYYNYNPKFSSGFPFEVIGGLNYPEGYFCDLIKEVESSVENSRAYEFPMADGLQVIAYKWNDKRQTVLVSITLPTEKKFDSDAIVRGIELTLENGQKIVREDEILRLVDNSAGTTALTKIISLPESDIELLTMHKIVKVKLNKFEETYKDGLTLQEYIKCVAN